MRRQLRGFATLTAVALMILLTAYLAIGAIASSQIELALGHSDVENRSKAWKTLNGALQSLKDSWDPTRQSFSVWKSSHPVSGVSWESLSGKVNLNTISPFLLGQAGFIDTLNGVPVQKFIETRSKNGPAQSLEFYSQMVRPAALASWYTVHSLWNINTADEDMLETMANQRTGSSSIGSALRASVRSYRTEMRRMSRVDWEQVAGTSKAVLEPLVTVEPELDVNEVSESLLQSILSYPNLKIADPAAKASSIVESRSSRPWDSVTLRQLLDVADGNLILSYLGTRTRFLAGTVNTGEGNLDWVVYLGGDALAPVVPRIIETRWRKL